MLDTICCSINCSVSLKYDRNKPDKHWIPKNQYDENKYKHYWEKIHNGITFHYYPYRYKNKKRNPLLWMEFSAATMQNGLNVIPYSFDNAQVAIKEIRRTIKEATGVDVRLQDIKTISRVDVNKNIRYHGEEEKEALRDFFDKFYCEGNQEKTPYDTGCEYGNNSVKCLFYFKDEDTNLGEELLSYMPEVARLEFQLYQYRIDKYYPEDLNLYTLLTNELATARVWKAMLREYRIGGKIYNYKRLMRLASELFKGHPRTKRRMMRQLKQVNDVNDTVKHRARTIEQTKEVIKELDEHGICPYSCELNLDLDIDILQILLKKRNAAGSICYAYFFPHHNSFVSSISHQDTS